MEYVVFSDESRHTEGRFRSIAAVSLPYISKNQYRAISAELGSTLEYLDKGELKWGNVGRSGSRNVKRAKRAIDFVLLNLSRGLRLDVLIWDTDDSRHSVDGRDDVANYSRMYFHLHSNLIERWGRKSYWHLRPDTLSTIDWNIIHECLNSRGTWRQHTEPVQGLFEDALQIAPHVLTFKEVDSAEAPFVQLADLFAGMAAYTRTKPQIIRALLAKEKGQQELFSDDVYIPADLPTKRDRGRFQVISHLNQRCKRASLGVSLGQHGYLLTPDPENPINFWHYQPQHPDDKAPTKT